MGQIGDSGLKFFVCAECQFVRALQFLCLGRVCPPVINLFLTWRNIFKTFVFLIDDAQLETS